ncbi:GNAT family N-acetyltransferase [Heyndrickxia acidicola]|uniref:GNAT family N-acetyltransferase n=1 Tax=Heyndrickxia acidicola TaxID=209389 RepID=A0ABU6MI21_9BACI|nr:GNAT family N-acetyltransferase [Heyndrickxia acidicola]MED1204326.1 GNAT family N-acetyltransferase [Heyndrickxia acidicola]
MHQTAVREAEERDIPELCYLMRKYIVDFYKRDTPKDSDLRAHIELLLISPELGLQLVAEVNHQIVGFATLYFTFSTLSLKRTAILNDLFVSSEFRGLKLGEHLFKECAKFVRENDLAGMTWETAEDNKIAQSLYEKLGGKRSEWLHYELS